MTETDRKAALDAYEKASMSTKSGKEAIREFHSARAALRKVNRELGTGKYAK